MKQRYILDSHKFLTPFVVLGLMAWFNQWHNLTAWLYLAMHGTYAYLWLIKSALFADKRWEKRDPYVNNVFMFLMLALYWIAPWIITSQDVQVSPPMVALCVALFTVGIFLHYTSDMQKHMTLELNPGHLVQDKLWGRLRNPNYLGELLIYLGYGLLAQHWLPIAVIAFVMLTIWLPNMHRKDASLARYAGFAAYKKHSWRLIPFIY